MHRLPGSRRLREGTFPRLQRGTSWWPRFPSSYRFLGNGQYRLRFRSSCLHPDCRHAFRPSISRHRSHCPRFLRASFREASLRQAHRSKAGSCLWRPSAPLVSFCRILPLGLRRRWDNSAITLPFPWRESCGTSSWSVSSTAPRARGQVILQENRLLPRSRV